MDLILKYRAEKAYLILAAIFLSALVVSNLIFQKFFQWSPFGIYTFELSVGILPYPITFIVTDVVSEIYGRRRANQMVFLGFIASVFTLGIIVIANLAPATDWSPINDQTFSQVFGFTYVAVGASMAAYLVAQLVDVQMFHFWKKLTNGKHLWLRNNASTFTSQLVDTLVILLILCSLDVIAWERFSSLLINGFMFKVLVAMADTPIVYFVVWLFRNQFKIKDNAEYLDY
ncbi:MULTISPECIES: queuosine precursor transporter [unclassified Lentimicrobium]|uniref:queuosine precursor transporter n=1 Tax=unclassified Lentimicrobium TaxID=2677434 RepID=UPI001551AB9F|nr:MULTISPECIES: queuosine precursor transporter [unclassified Lentimicrobium]NPD47653.1 queuosine precursor transporter [Lentimicrobium sp. S6]NPD86996.1 queuosine precursor transporter [Lentimicrobium sp. L6]